MISREDVAWGLAVAIAALLCLALLPLAPVCWLLGRGRARGECAPARPAYKGRDGPAG